MCLEEIGANPYFVGEGPLALFKQSNDCEFFPRVVTCSCVVDVIYCPILSNYD